MNRRIFVAGGGALIAGMAAWQLWPAPALVFDTAGVPDGYRRLVLPGAGGITAALSGVSLGPAVTPLTGTALCRVTFEGGPQTSGAVTIASFSDYFCPYCRVLDEMLRDTFEDDRAVQFVWHQVPLLGRASEMAARGILAARAQGVEDLLHRRLIRTSFVPNPAYLRDFAREAGIEGDRFMADLHSDATQAHLDSSARAFRAFGFAGTPGLVVGRTVVSGAISKQMLRALVAAEIASAGPCA